MQIECSQSFMFFFHHLKVQNDLRNATLDLSSNGIVRGKKSKPADEMDGERLKRTHSAESINTFHTPISKFDNSSDDFNKHRVSFSCRLRRPTNSTFSYS